MACERGLVPCERGRSPAAARSASRAPPAEGRSFWRGCSSLWRVARSRTRSGDVVRGPRRGRSTAERCESRRVPSPPASLDAPCLPDAFAGLAGRRGPSAPSARLLVASRPAPPAAGLPRSWPADPPDGRGLRAGAFELLPTPEAVRPAFVPPLGPPPARPFRPSRSVFGLPPPGRPPLALRPCGVPRPSATQTNLQHLATTQYPDKRRGPLDLIGSDPLQACPAASYSPTRSPAQYHRR